MAVVVLSEEQSTLINNCFDNIRKTLAIGKDPKGIPIGKSVIDIVIKPLNDRLKADEKGFDVMMAGLNNDELYKVTRVLMQSCLEATNDDVLRSSFKVVSGFYREMVQRLKFDPEKENHPPQIVELNKIEFQSIMGSPDFKLKATANVIYFTVIGRDATSKALVNFKASGIEEPFSPLPGMKTSAVPPPIPDHLLNQSQVKRTPPPIPESHKKTVPIQATPANQVSMDKIDNANDTVTLKTLLSIAKANIDSVDGHFKKNLELIKMHTGDKNNLLASRYQDALSEAKTATQNASFVVVISEKLLQLEPDRAVTYGKDIQQYKQEMKKWMDNSGQLMQQAMKKNISLTTKPAQGSRFKFAADGAGESAKITNDDTSKTFKNR
jgi:hypothetical protein